MKKILFCLFGLLWSINTLAQNVSIELSIHWQMEKDIFDEDLMMNTPFLNITYRNNSDENIYFNKVSSPNRVGLPPTGRGILLQYPYNEWLNPNWRNRAESSVKMSPYFMNENYRIRIGDLFSLFKVGWHIVNEADSCVECEVDIINDCLTDIHEFIYYKKYPERIRAPSEFRLQKNDLSEEGILSVIKDLFVFLKPNEIYTDTFNLVAFQVVKGTFTFTIKKDTIPDFVWGDYFRDDTQNKYTEQKIKLPDKVGEYHIYSGSFFTNSVTVEFSRSVIDSQIDPNAIPMQTP